MPRPRMNVKATSRNQLKSIQKRARMLRKDPSLIAPICEGDCRSCPFKRIIKGAERISTIEDEDYIKKFFKKGDQLLRAYAVLISADINSDIPYMATADTPSGKVAYIYKEGADKKGVISLMYNTDPKLSLMGYIAIAKKHRLHLYATRKGPVCTGREAKPPAEFMSLVEKNLPYNFRHSGERYSVPPAELTVSLGEIEISISRKAASSDSNIPMVIQSFMYSPERDAGLDISIIFELEGRADGCDGRFIPTKQERKAYLSGKISDKEFLDSAWEDFRNDAEDRGLYMAGKTCFGSSPEQMINGLDMPDALKKSVTDAVARRKRGIVVDDYTANKILMEIWDEAAYDILTSISSEGIAKQVMAMEKQNPMDMIRAAEDLLKKREVNSSLPLYKNLPEIAAFADRAAREYRISGKKGMESFLYSVKKPNTKIKSLQMAFLMAIGEHEGKEWHYSRNERDFAEFLMPTAKRLLEAKKDKYHQILKELMAAAGAESNLDSYLIKKP